ncbi:MAG: tetraacyldisaccharide 4'-kinase [Elusimicrobia bacterium]|nr:tetraacyldisaccharide 4'-kinase [Elusimicrobiota bacterium]
MAQVNNRDPYGIRIVKAMHKSFLGRAFLWTLSLFYRVAVVARNLMYEKKILKTFSVPSRVVCFGNLTAGGTGKTTAVMLAAKILSEQGVRVAIVSRGYKRKSGKLVILENENPSTWEEAGDEPYMLFHSLKQYNVPVIVCADRVRAAEVAVKKFHSQIILLDDGFQHRRLKRDADVVLIDAKNPFGGNHLLPLGLLREPKNALRRASLALITHANLAGEIRAKATAEQIQIINPKLPVIKTAHEPEHYFNICSGAKIALAQLRGPACAISAIGDPESFEETLRRLGLKLEQVWRYPDHHVFTERELLSVQNLRANMPLVTTYKDLTRFPQNWRKIIRENGYVLSIHLKMDEKDIDLLKKVLYPYL